MGTQEIVSKIGEQEKKILFFFQVYKQLVSLCSGQKNILYS